MAQRRMFSPKVTSTDRFLDMPVSARELYFQLGMNADDDGFITPKKIVRMIGASDDDLKVLIAKNFVIPFQSGVIVITAWKINNLIRKDWYQETIYKEEKDNLQVDDKSGEYKLVNEMLTEVRLGKVRLVEDRIEDKSSVKESSKLKENSTNTTLQNEILRDCVFEIFDFWKFKLNHPNAKLDRKRTIAIEKAIKLKFSVEEMKDAIEGLTLSPYHMGGNEQGKVYDDLDLIFRDAKHIENFINIKKNGGMNVVKKIHRPGSIECARAIIDQVDAIYNPDGEIPF